MNPPLWFEAGVDSDLQVFWEDGERIFCRIKRDLTDGDPNSVLAVLLAAEHPTPDSLIRLTNEYALKGNAAILEDHDDDPVVEEQYSRQPPFPED
jgi:hypothetical protein